jgi:phosphoribosylaminoimidazole carboxylase (NCAIR synthetase)
VKNSYKYSLLRKLRDENKTTDEFEVMFSSLTLEEVIGLKLELAARASKGKYFGFPIWQNMVDIVRESVLRHTIATTPSKAEAARCLGMTKSNLSAVIRKYNL